MELDGLSRGDHRIELVRGEEKLSVRVIKFRLKSGEIETLITDMREG
jgi:DNA-binding transcriptional regulator LsrR (DeoR family)